MRQKKCHEFQQGKYEVPHPREEQSRHQDMLISHQLESRSALHILGFLIEFALSTESISNMLSLLRFLSSVPSEFLFPVHSTMFCFFSLTMFFSPFIHFALGIAAFWVLWPFLPCQPRTKWAGSRDRPEVCWGRDHSP